MAKGIKRAINCVLKNVNADIKSIGDNGGYFARGLSGEGHAGGYRQALYDVLLALNGVEPNGRYGKFFEDDRENA